MDPEVGLSAQQQSEPADSKSNVQAETEAAAAATPAAEESVQQGTAGTSLPQPCRDVSQSA